jgi:hypothetical protein
MRFDRVIPEIYLFEGLGKKPQVDFSQGGCENAKE